MALLASIGFLSPFFTVGCIDHNTERIVNRLAMYGEHNISESAKKVRINAYVSCEQRSLPESNSI